MDVTGLFAVTGAGSGIGRGVAARLTEAGADVVVLDANVKAAEAVAAELDCTAHELDVSDPAQVATVFGRLGPLRGLVNCAGISDVASIVSLSAESWQRVVGVHLNGTFYCLQAAARNMLTNDVSGTIVNISSVNARFGHRGLSAYSAAKAGVSMLTTVAALEFAQAGIRVNAVAPGIVNTGMTGQVLQDPSFVETWTSSIPLGRIAEPVDVADVVLFLSSPSSRWVTGQVLAVDGGGSLRVEPKMFPDDSWAAEALRSQF